MMGVSSKQPTHWPPRTAWYIVGFDKKRVSLSMKDLLPKPNADEAEADDAE